jgi:16S rRNA (uracil1498-N3)-methyltransferase
MSRTPRLFVGQRLDDGGTLLLEGEAAAHLGRVLRARPGEAVALFDGDGSEHEGEILDAGRRRVRIAVGAARPACRESALSLAL